MNLFRHNCCIILCKQLNTILLFLPDQLRSWGFHEAHDLMNKPWQNMANESNYNYLEQLSLSTASVQECLLVFSRLKTIPSLGHLQNFPCALWRWGRKQRDVHISILCLELQEDKSKGGASTKIPPSLPSSTSPGAKEKIALPHTPRRCWKCYRLP